MSRGGWSIVGIAVLAAGLAAWWSLHAGDETVGGAEPGTPARGDGAPPGTGTELAGAPGVRPTAAQMPGPVGTEASPPSANTAAPDAGPVRHLALVGRVVDGRRFSVEGADVEFVGEGWTAAPARTDAKGRFRLSPTGRAASGRWLRAMLHVRGGNARGALGEAHAEAREGEDIDLGTIELRPALTVSARVLANSKPVAGARVEVWASGEERATPTRIGEVVTDAKGDARLDGVPVGWVNLLARGPDGWLGLASAEIGVEEGDSTIEVSLREPRWLDVLVETTAEPAVPIAGARVACLVQMETGRNLVHDQPFTPSPAASPTGPDGHTRMTGLPPGVELQVEAETGGGTGRAKVRGSDTAVTVAIATDKPASLAFPVTAGERPVPAEGTRLRIIPDVTCPDPADEREGRIEGGSIVVPAIAPDGGVAPLRGGSSDGDGIATEFAVPRRLVVHVSDADGHPVVGIDFVPWHGTESAWAPPHRTGADGRAAFEGLPPWPYVIHGFLTAQDDWGYEIGNVDLSARDATSEIVLGVEREVIARVTIDGKPGLPSRLECRVDDAIVLATDEDAQAGEVSLRVRAMTADAAHDVVRIGGRGFHQAGVAFDWPSAGAVVTVPVALGRTPEVVAIVRGGADSPVYVRLERWDDEAWKDVQGTDAIETPGRRTFTISTPGRHRLRDLRTGIVSAPFEVRDGAPPIETTIDLASLAVVRGRIEAPEGTKPGSVFVVAEGDGIDMRTGYGPGRGIQRDGTFEVRFPRGRRVTIRPWHQTLKAVAGDEGSVVVDGPREGIVLRLSGGPTVRLRVVDPAGSEPGVEDARGRLWVRGTAEPEADWESRDFVRAEDGSVFALALPIGEVELWIDLPPHAPRSLGRRALVDGVTNLEPARLERGSNLSVRPRSAKGKPPASVWGVAERIEHPPFRRDARDPESPGSPFTVPGLSKGTWKLMLWWKTPTDEERTLEKDIEVDGVTDVAIDVDTD